MSAAGFKTIVPCAAILLAALCLAGCGSSAAPPADPHQATVSLKAALEKWKEGAPVNSLHQQSPAVYVLDEDWQDGQKLVSFEVRDALNEGTFARIPVRLHIQAPNGLWWKEVEYKVSTDRVVSIVRHDD